MSQTQVSLVILFNFARWGSRPDFQLPPFNPSLHKYDRQAISMWVMLSSRYLGDWNHTNTELQLNASLRSTLSCYLSSSGVNGSQIKIGEETLFSKYTVGIIAYVAPLSGQPCFAETPNDGYVTHNAVPLVAKTGNSFQFSVEGLNYKDVRFISQRYLVDNLYESLLGADLNLWVNYQLFTFLGVY